MKATSLPTGISSAERRNAAVPNLPRRSTNSRANGTNQLFGLSTTTQVFIKSPPWRFGMRLPLVGLQPAQPRAHQPMIAPDATSRRDDWEKQQDLATLRKSAGQKPPRVF